MSDYKIINSDEAPDLYSDSSVPGEFRPLTHMLGCKQVALTLIRVPPHSDFEQSTGHYHDELEEVYIITRGTLTMRFDDDITKVSAGSAVRVGAKVKRSHRNEGNEFVDMWAISIQLGRQDAHKIDDFWKASDLAKQRR